MLEWFFRYCNCLEVWGTDWRWVFGGCSAAERGCLVLLVLWWTNCYGLTKSFRTWVSDKGGSIKVFESVTVDLRLRLT